MQQQSFAQAYLDSDRPADALRWLEGTWGNMDASRQSMLADALERLGRFKEASLRQPWLHAVAATPGKWRQSVGVERLESGCVAAANDRAEI